jgi:calcium-dependent protein kinase
MQKLSEFQMKNKLKMAILEFISVQVVSSQEKEELLKMFQQLDKDGDGMVSKGELFCAYKKFYSDSAKAKQIVDEIFEDMDANQSGKVDFSGTQTINLV